MHCRIAITICLSLVYGVCNAQNALLDTFLEYNKNNKFYYRCLNNNIASVSIKAYGSDGDTLHYSLLNTESVTINRIDNLISDTILTTYHLNKYITCVLNDQKLIKSKEELFNSSNDLVFRKHLFFYDKQGRLEKSIYYAKNDTVTSLFTYTNGELTTLSYKNNNLIADTKYSASADTVYCLTNTYTQNKITSKTTMKHKLVNGNVVYTSVFESDGKTVEYVYTFTNNGDNLIVEEVTDGLFTERIVYKGNLPEYKLTYSPGNNVYRKEEYYYKY